MGAVRHDFASFHPQIDPFQTKSALFSLAALTLHPTYHRQVMRLRFQSFRARAPPPPAGNQARTHRTAQFKLCERA